MKPKLVLARIGISLAAVSLFLLMRIDVASAAKHKLAVELLTQLESPRIISGYLQTNSVRKLQNVSVARALLQVRLARAGNAQ